MSPKTYNVDALIEELELDKEDIVELLGDFNDFLKSSLPELEAAINSGDIAQTRSVSHSIKGSAGNLRVQDVFEIAKQMQDAADANKAEELKDLMTKMTDASNAFFEEAKELS